MIESFAKHVHPEGHLIVKLHPMDNGIERWESMIRRLVKQHGTVDRVLAVSECDLKWTRGRNLGGARSIPLWVCIACALVRL